MIATMSVDNLGQVTFPQWLREKLNLTQGSTIQLIIDDEQKEKPIQMVIEPPKFKSGFGMLKTKQKIIDTDFDVSVFAKDN